MNDQSPGSSRPEDSVASNDQVDLDVQIRAIGGGDQQAFASFYEATINRVYGLAFRVVHNHEGAEDVVSEVYLQIWRQAQNYDATRGPVIAWIMIICRSRALDYLRRNTQHIQIETSDSGKHSATNIENIAHDTPPLTDLILATEHRTLVNAALKQLSNHQRQLLSLAFYRDYSHQQLAAFTRLPLGTVKTQIRRAIIKLKEYLSEYNLDKPI